MRFIGLASDGFRRGGDDGIAGGSDEIRRIRHRLRVPGRSSATVFASEPGVAEDGSPRPPDVDASPAEDRDERGERSREQHALRHSGSALRPARGGDTRPDARPSPFELRRRAPDGRFPTETAGATVEQRGVRSRRGTERESVRGGPLGAAPVGPDRRTRPGRAARGASVPSRCRTPSPDRTADEPGGRRGSRFDRSTQPETSRGRRRWSTRPTAPIAWYTHRPTAGSEPARATPTDRSRLIITSIVGAD